MIPVNEPLIAHNALKYVTECINTGWISSAGEYLEKFEKSFADYLGVKHSITTTSGTSSLHLALASLDIGTGTEVIIPALTMIAVPFAVNYTGASCVPVDVDPVFYNIDPESTEEIIKKHYKLSSDGTLVNKVTGKILKAIIVVHLYGHPCDMKPLMQIARKYGLHLIEDAAEAHGAEYLKDINNENDDGDNDNTSFKAGSMGDVGCFSFYANKIITTGEGGMLVTNDDRIAENARRLKDLSHSTEKRFVHTGIGFNYRMTNMQAAVGLAQLEEIDRFVNIKRSIAHKYNSRLAGVSGLVLPKESSWAKNVYWMYSILVNSDFGMERDGFMKKLKDMGIDTRSFFMPLDEQPIFNSKNYYKGEDWPVCRDLSRRGLYLPSGLALTDGQIDKVCDSISEISA